MHHKRSWIKWSITKEKKRLETMSQIHLLISSSIRHCWVEDTYLRNKIDTTPALSRSEALPGSDAISRKAVPLRTNCAAPDDSSTTTTVTPVSEHKLLPVHFTWLRRQNLWVDSCWRKILLKIYLQQQRSNFSIPDSTIHNLFLLWTDLDLLKPLLNQKETVSQDYHIRMHRL